MVGDRQIVEFRKRGYKPAAIFVHAGEAPLKARWYWQDPEQALATNQHATVYVLPDEMGQRLDMRFVVGCRVHLMGQRWDDQFLALMDRIIDCGAEHVIACCIGDNGSIVEYERGEWRGHADSDA